MKNIIYYLFIVLILNSNLIYSQSKNIDSVLSKFDKKTGFVTSYFNGSKLYFEFPKSFLKKELLMVTRISKIPSDFDPYMYSGNKRSEQVVEFSSVNDKIVLRQMTYTDIAQENDPIIESVIVNNNPPILAAFKNESKNDSLIIINVTDFFNNDSPSFNIISKRNKDANKIGSVDKKRSFIENVKTFKNNTEVRTTLTFSASQLRRTDNTKSYTFQINNSIIQLPEVPMQIRKSDSRVGWFSLNKNNYSTDKYKTDSYTITRRWRLVPKDIEAYNTGELVEPVKPIIFYLDPATPIMWKPFIKKGVEDWNKSFEKAGFKNAIIAKDAPSKDENPDFSPEDIRYSTIRYIATTTQNAIGPSVSDPRTGEIIESDIIWFHNHFKSYTHRYLIETGAANPKARTLDLSLDDIGGMMQRTISHEVGHALGLPHNMKSSSAYPVDSLRSFSFTKKMGIATTIMEYARYNYVAQPGDKIDSYYRKFGPYDDYSIEWGYRYFEDENSANAKNWLKKFVDDRSLNPIYMFGRGYQNDPNAQTEDIGDNAILASDYGIRNLKIVADNLDKWVNKDGKDFSELEELYTGLLRAYTRYIYHVEANIGGIYRKEIHSQQSSDMFTNVPRERQIEALKFLNKNIFDTPNWLIKQKWIVNIDNDEIISDINRIQTRVLNRIISTSKLNRMISAYETIGNNSLKTVDVFKILTSYFINDKNLDVSKQALQVNYIKRLKNVSNDDDLHPVVASEINYELKTIRNKLSKFKKSSKKNNLKNHFGILKEYLNSN